MREIHGTASHFTPVFDLIAQDPDLGPVAGLVFGKVWRYCNAYGKCTASLERMAGEAGLSRATFKRWVKKLDKAGYLEDLTPARKDRPHEYRDTGKVRMVVRVTAEGGSERPTKPAFGGSERPTGGSERPTKRVITDRDTGADAGKEREIAAENDFPLSLPTILPNGQYRGKTLREVLELGDDGYVRWIAENWNTESVRQEAADILAEAGLNGAGQSRRWTFDVGGQ